jgi:hypothetical protein
MADNPLAINRILAKPVVTTRTNHRLKPEVSFVLIQLTTNN